MAEEVAKRIRTGTMPPEMKEAITTAVDAIGEVEA